jgi:hypothetical protein
LFADATIARPDFVVPSAGGLLTSQSCVSRLTTWLNAAMRPVAASIAMTEFA